jgi:hypothetical protein
MHDSLPTSARGRGRVLTDKELDATYAQGLSIVNISFGFRHGGGSFRFDSTTRINTPNTPSAGTTVGFLGGAVSVSTGSTGVPNGTSSTSGNSGVNAPATQPANQGISANGGSTVPAGQTPVSVTFGTVTGPGAGRVLNITANGGVTVDSVVSIRVGVTRQIRNLFGRI